MAIRDIVTRGYGPGAKKTIATHGYITSAIPAFLPIGTVPIRYVIGVIPNVVPVETVGAGGIGVVPCRVQVGPANVVPVRETASETPRVKIVLV